MSPYLLMTWGPRLAYLALVVVGLAVVRPRASRAGVLFAVAGALPLLINVLQLVSLPLPGLVPSLLRSAAMVLLFLAFLDLLDAVHPTSARPLPAVLVQFPIFSGPNLFLRGMVTGVTALAFFAVPLFMPEGGPIEGVLGVVAFVVGWTVVERRATPQEKWLLDRRPELVVWGYVLQLDYRRSGRSAFSVRVGLETGAMLTLTANTRDGAEAMLAALVDVRPGISTGYSEALFAKFKADPRSLLTRTAASSPGAGATPPETR